MKNKKITCIKKGLKREYHRKVERSEIKTEPENIPIYSEQDFKEAIEYSGTHDELVGAYEDLRHKAINGYASFFRVNCVEWFVWRWKGGQIYKLKYNKNYLAESDKNEWEEKIKEVQRKAIRGENVQGKRYCKFTYDLEDQEKFSRVVLPKEYIQSDNYTDCGAYGGIHFVEMDNINYCTDHRYTQYGNKVVILELIKGEIYYEYRNHTFFGKQVYAKKVMYLDEIETWKYLSSITTTIKTKKEEFISYLKVLNDNRDYSKCIKYLRKL